MLRKRVKARDILRQVAIQAFLLGVTMLVLFPVLWTVSLAIDPRNIDKPLKLTLIPPGASFQAFHKVLSEPFQLLCKDPSDVSSCMTFVKLLKNSLAVALGTSLFAVVAGASAAYAFSRFRFIGRQAGMLGFIVLLMLPSTGGLAPLYVLLSQIKIAGEPLRASLVGLAIAYAASALPFAVWNLKGYFDTVPKELEEAALIDGAGIAQTFLRIILPLSAPALAVTVLFSFMAGWTEFIMAWVFLEDPARFTLAMALRSMQGQFSTPWSEFAAMSIVMSIPILLLFFLLQRYIVSGLTLGGGQGITRSGPGALGICGRRRSAGAKSTGPKQARLRIRLAAHLRTKHLLLLASLLFGCRGPAGPLASSLPGGKSPDAGVSPTPPSLPTPTPETSLPTSAPLPTPIPYDTPDWFRGAVLYEIFVRSFADSNGDGIGDLAGVTEKLDYIQELGADAIWLMPIYPSPSEHGYDVTDFQAVNPAYGSIDDLQKLVLAAHSRQLRVLLDFPPSHLSNQHPFFEDAYGNSTSPYSDWFVWTNDRHTTYASFAGNERMPRFNHFNASVADYLCDAARFWLDLDGDGDYEDGIDGFRIDNATFPPAQFFLGFRQCLKAASRDVLLLGETWVHSPRDLALYFDDQFDALFDFPLYELLQGNPSFNADGLLAGKGHPALLTRLLGEEMQRFPTQAIVVRFLSNHDTNRLATELGSDAARLRMAAGLLVALPGPVLVYYGEEIGMLGQKGGPPAWDNYRREPMDWYAQQEGLLQTTWFRPADRLNQPGDQVSVEEQASDPESLLRFYQRVLNLRSSQLALRQGDFADLEIAASAVGPWGFVRQFEDETIVVLVNFAAGPAEATVKSFPFASLAPLDLLTGEAYPPVQTGQPYTLRLGPASIVILRGSESN